MTHMEGEDTTPRFSHGHPALRMFTCTLLFHTIIAYGAGDKPTCIPQIQVTRGTAHTTSPGKRLELHCPVQFCRNTVPQLSWLKIWDVTFQPIENTTRIQSGWETFSYSSGTFRLTFQEVFQNDSGLYKCSSGGAESHQINVSVTENAELTPHSSQNDISQDDGDSAENMPMAYLYPVVGVIGLVALAILISFLAMRDGQSVCGKQKGNEVETEPDPTLINSQMNRRPQPGGSSHFHPISVHGIPLCTNGSALSSPDDHTQANGQRVSAVQISPDLIYNNRNIPRRAQGRTRGGDGEERESPLVYASLNHQMLTATSPRRQRPREETSEYAAILIPPTRAAL